MESKYHITRKRIGTYISLQVVFSENISEEEMEELLDAVKSSQTDKLPLPADFVEMSNIHLPVPIEMNELLKECIANMRKAEMFYQGVSQNPLKYFTR